MTREVLTDGRAIPVDQIEYALRDPRVVHDLGKNDAADRRDFARLQHHRAARSDGRRHLADDLIERPVPWGDESHHADRLANDARIAALVGKLEFFEGLDGRLKMYLAGPRLCLARE